MLGELSIKEFVMGEENFHEGSAGFTSIIKKKNKEKINMKEFFSAGSKEQHYNLKRTENITHMRGSPPPITSLFTLKYF